MSARERLMRRLALLEADAEVSKDYERKGTGERMVLVLWENVALLRESVEAALAEHEGDARRALRGIIEIGKRDLTNPKYDGFFQSAHEALAKAEGQQ